MSEFSTEDMLGDKEIPEVEPETPEEPTEPAGEELEPEKPIGEEPKGDEPEKPKGESSGKDDSTPESKASEKTEEEKEHWTVAAVKDERRKRQELQAELDKLKKQPSQEGEQKKPDWFNDPETAANQQQQQMQQMLFEQRAVMGQEMMREKHQDFDEMEAKFFHMLEANPHLGDGMRSAANPAKYAYETAKKADEAEALKDVDSYKAKLEADVRKDVEAKVRAEYEAKAQKQQEKEGAILPTLSGASSKGGLTSEDYSGPTDLNEILK